ncbi:MAG: STAS domain-containing protein [Spirochaetales bacterium]|nr:STAS domain-containing protein [Spirochaetales bacterium]
MAGLMIATMMAGVILVLMGVCRLGSVIKFVPYPVIVGFTGGIALTIFSTQMNDFFGLGLTGIPADFIHKWIFYFQNFTRIHWPSFFVGLGSLAVIVIMPKLTKKIPGSLVAIILATVAVWLLKKYANVTGINTIADVHTLPSGFPMPQIPHLELKNGETMLSLIQNLVSPAFTIAILGAIESLLSAMVADGVIADKHHSNTELIAQGCANILSPLFGGIPATGAIARTMTNINNGGRTPIAGIVHACVLTLVLLFFGRFVGMIPMPCLAAVLVMVAYNMSGWRTFVSLSKAPKSDFSVLIATFVLTVVFDLTIAIEIGLLMALVLFLRRTNETTEIRVFKHEIDPKAETDAVIRDEQKLVIPEGVAVYEIDGPYFFGIANKFEEVMMSVGDKPKVRIIRMRKVAFIDSTGLHNLATLCRRSDKENVKIVLSGVNEKVHNTLARAGFYNIVGEQYICSNINEALNVARGIIGEK